MFTFVTDSLGHRRLGGWPPVLNRGSDPRRLQVDCSSITTQGSVGTQARVSKRVNLGNMGSNGYFISSIFKYS